jgi:hypothetical protein
MTEVLRKENGDSARERVIGREDTEYLKAYYTERGCKEKAPTQRRQSRTPKPRDTGHRANDIRLVARRVLTEYGLYTKREPRHGPNHRVAELTNGGWWGIPTQIH